MINMRSIGVGFVAALTLSAAASRPTFADETKAIALFAAKPGNQQIVQISGRVADVQAYDLLVRDDKNQIVDVQFTGATAVTPDPDSLRNGERVVVTGRTRGNVVAADAVDLPDADGYQKLGWPVRPTIINW